MVRLGKRMWNPMFSPNWARARSRTSEGSMGPLSYGMTGRAASTGISTLRAPGRCGYRPAIGVVIQFSASDHAGVLAKTWRVATVAVKRQAVRSHRDARDAKGDTPALRRTRECAGTQVARPSRYLRRRHACRVSAPGR